MVCYTSNKINILKNEKKLNFKDVEYSDYLMQKLLWRLRKKTLESNSK